MSLLKLVIILLIFIADKILQYLQITPTWFNYYADDILFLPLCLSLALWVQQRFINPLFVFSVAQIVLTWLACSVLFEGIYPYLITGFTQDPFDILAYALGAFIFAQFLNQGAVKRME